MNVALERPSRNDTRDRHPRFVLTGHDRWAHNAPGQPRGVSVEATSIAGAGMEVEAPPLRVALDRFELRR